MSEAFCTHCARSYRTTLENKVMSLHRVLNASSILECDESKTLVSSRFAVKHDMCIDHLAELGEEVPQAPVVDGRCETADKDLCRFGMLCLGDGSFGIDLETVFSFATPCSHLFCTHNLSVYGVVSVEDIGNHGRIGKRQECESPRTAVGISHDATIPDRTKLRKVR